MPEKQHPESFESLESFSIPNTTITHPDLRHVSETLALAMSSERNLICQLPTHIIITEVSSVVSKPLVAICFRV
jgi:hypothetical protein